MQKWEYCEIYKRLTNLTYANQFGKNVNAVYFNVVKFSKNNIGPFGGEVIKESRPWLPDATAVENSPKNERGQPDIIYRDEKTVLRTLIAELGLDGWELIYLNDIDESNKPVCLFKRKI